ncbi:hypothetical protein EJB05_39792, partial [Eragrostis curvula]
MGLASLSALLLFPFLVSLCASDDQLTPAKPLTFPNDKLVSSNGVFAMGFFSRSQTNSRTRFYIGIWYNNIPKREVVWVANRDNPIIIPSSATLAVTDRSDIVLSDPDEGRIYWSMENNVTATGGAGASVTLSNDGNLILPSSNGTILWQSFDHPPSRHAATDEQPDPLRPRSAAQLIQIFNTPQRLTNDKS